MIRGRRLRGSVLASALALLPLVAASCTRGPAPPILAPETPPLGAPAAGPFRSVWVAGFVAPAEFVDFRGRAQRDLVEIALHRDIK